ncbi:hypothetical protein [Galbitalea soli]|uniref:Uncharacterized protein n=1 Tax=Galbitalea soli TaxID=1268042 RepID=A0A7C9TN62_9MICO|nr:hypothetical protein [Galbitalea soli]NEM89935.1 hypothetical protein [Galbitalea soli]NYJ30641.1 hypothetical protein [Galbitalea soli]
MDRFTSAGRRRLGLAASLVTGLVIASVSIGTAAFASGSTVHPVSSAKTPAWSNGQTVTIQYPQNYFCDTSVSSSASSGCEVGTAANVGPVANPNRSVLYVLVPLFANPSPAPMCAEASCPNHPMNIDLSRIAGALGASPDAVADVPLPAHSHILDGNAGGWWQVKIVAVTNEAAWSKLAADKSQATMDALLATSNSGVLGPIPTNMYLFFNVVGQR